MDSSSSPKSPRRAVVWSTMKSYLNEAVSSARTRLNEHVPQFGALEQKYRQLWFSRIYQHNFWLDSESRSGPGSTLKATESIRRELPEVLRKAQARTMLDVPCGDFNWMQHVELDLEQYIGADIVPDLIALNQQRHGSERRQFIVRDLIQDDLPKVGLVMVRDLFIHLSYRNIFRALANLRRSGTEHLLATTHVGLSRNEDIVTGLWRPVNLRLAPFHFPEPIHLVEDAHKGRHMGLWRFADLDLSQGQKTGT
ncbi:class I SAM-dependent methyltransferase [Myxococcus sp. CA051A]|nr:class I SAM-dependent methyltransferase [Myxococcus sp. CA051A]